MSSHEQFIAKLAEHITVKPAGSDQQNHHSVWYIQVLLAFCGWFAAVFILAFVATGVSFVLDYKFVCFILGCAGLAAVYALFKGIRSEFTHHIGLAVSLASQGLIAYALGDLFDLSQSYFWLAVMVVELLLVLVMPSFLHQVFSTFIACCCFYALLYEWQIATVGNALLAAFVVALWWHEYRPDAANIRRLHGAGYGAVIALLCIKSTVEIGEYQSFETMLGNSWYFISWLDELLIQVVLLVLVGGLLKRYKMGLSNQVTIAIWVTVILFCASSFIAPGISIGLIILLLGFSASNTILIVLGIAALLLYVSNYYYYLALSLLTKSIALAAVGVVLLTCHFIAQRMAKTRSQDNE